MDFTDADYQDFTYELNDGELVNDVLCIVGASGAEVLVRGYDTGSITKYGRRSFRIDNPVTANVEAAYATPKAQVTEILDRNIEPYANIQIVVMNLSDALTAGILGLEISDLCHITQTTCGLSAIHFIVESSELSIDLKGYLTATIGLVQARAGEYAV
jgi:hypothetical protein